MKIFALIFVCIVESLISSILFGQPSSSINLTPIALELRPKHDHILNFNGIRRVQKLYIDAEGIRSDAMFEVIVNGDIKGTIHVPARDPEFVVTIAESTDRVLLRHKQGGIISIKKVVAVIATLDNPPRRRNEDLPVPRGVAAQLAKDIIELCDTLIDNPHTSNDDSISTILPIKRAAGRVYAVARANGDLSRRVLEKLDLLLCELKFADNYFEVALSDSERFSHIVDLLSKREELSEMLD